MHTFEHANQKKTETHRRRHCVTGAQSQMWTKLTQYDRISCDTARTPFQKKFQANQFLPFDIKNASNLILTDRPGLAADGNPPVSYKPP